MFVDSKLAEEQLIVTDAGGQLVWGPALAERINQFDYVDGLALRWHPRGRSSVILVDPRIAFGAPVISRTGVPAWVVKDRVAAGEDLGEIEEDFGLTRGQVNEATKDGHRRTIWFHGCIGWHRVQQAR
jgi:uncharacterized protein (DUF433 family)